MDALFAFIFSERGLVIGALLMWVFSSAIQAMPEPKDCSSQAYIFLYQFLHLLGANWQQVATAGIVQRMCKKP